MNPPVSHPSFNQEFVGLVAMLIFVIASLGAVASLVGLAVSGFSSSWTTAVIGCGLHVGFLPRSSGFVREMLCRTLREFQKASNDFWDGRW